MKKPEEIKKGLECCSTGNYLSCRKCPYEQNGCGQNENLTDALACIKQLEAQVPTWISVEDRLPRDGENRYLVCLDDGFTATAVWDDGWELWADAGAVTHWMPLPEPPKV